MVQNSATQSRRQGTAILTSLVQWKANFRRKLWRQVTQEPPPPQTKDDFLKILPDPQEAEMTINSRAVCFNQRKIPSGS